MESNNEGRGKEMPPWGKKYAYLSQDEATRVGRYCLHCNNRLRFAIALNLPPSLLIEISVETFDLL